MNDIQLPSSTSGLRPSQQLTAVTQQLQYDSNEYHTTAVSENIHSPGSHANASPLITAAVTLIQMSSPPQAPRHTESDHSGLSPLLHNCNTNMWSVFVAHGRLCLMSSLETAVSEPRGDRVFIRDLHRHCGTEGSVVRYEDMRSHGICEGNRISTFTLRILG